MRILALILCWVTILVSSQVFAQADYRSLKHVDLRDLRDNPTYLNGTSNLIINKITDNPEIFGLPSHVRFYEHGARGPRGDVITGNDGKEYFAPSEDQSGRAITRQDTVFAIEIEDINEESTDKVFVLRLILFIHDSANQQYASSHGYYFKRLTVRVDWFQPADGNRFQVLSFDQEIPLSQTKFSVYGDILDRKIILEDPVNAITKVFPVGLGSFDIRTMNSSLDGSVMSLTREFPPYEQAYITKANITGGGAASNNTEARTYPSYYRGRPFLGIYTGDGVYHQIGMHYQIDSEGLKRGFISHGCIRIRDKDLYQLSAIVNNGPNDKVPVQFVYHLGGRYEHLTHPMSFYPTYNAVVYSSALSQDRVQCPTTSYSVERVGAQSQFHTLADGDCLTMVKSTGQSASMVVDYLLGRSNKPPYGLYSPGRSHVYGSAVDIGNDDYESEGGKEEKQRRRRGFLAGIFGGRNDFEKAEVARPPAVIDTTIYVMKVYTPPQDNRIRFYEFESHSLAIPTVATEKSAIMPTPEVAAAIREAEEKINYIQSNRSKYCGTERAVYKEYCDSWDRSLDEWMNYLNQKKQ